LWGQNSLKVTTFDQDLTPLPEMDAFTLYFDRIGIPYEYQVSDIVAITTAETIQIGSRSLAVTPETGFVE